MEESKSKAKSVIVIGAGVGGVATAARLAKAGFKVTVLEKNDFTGGRCSLINHDGYRKRFDQGPSLLLLPRFFEEIFHDLGTSLSAEGIELLKCEPNYNIWFGDGCSFELSTDLTKMKTSIEAIEGKDGFERYLSFLQESHRHYEISVACVLRKNFSSFFNMARPEMLLNLLALHPFQSIWTQASKYFWTERLRRVFTFGSMYMGMSPFDAPATYSLLQYTELAEGIMYPKGGFHRQHLIPTEPSFYVNVPSRVDPSAAPEGKDSIVVLVPVGHLLSDKSGTHRGLSKSAKISEGIVNSTQDWESMVSLITHEIINTPCTWQGKFNLDKGAILGLSHSFFNVLAFRPGTQHSQFKNLYFVGATCGTIMLMVWICYPIAWDLREGGNIIGPDSEAVFYGILDLLEKPVGAILLGSSQY
ncbi:hypothetical protein N0V84_002157 [Fusarium piperis]|uniref:Phytoene desaturase n=1 Tax=Fusarium piperis TaxID=1435070 RepID=A0A9W8WK23_9HYPO|nr:hypothetical protein N0V84_002157 [Fusarium piperis]